MIQKSILVLLIGILSINAFSQNEIVEYQLDNGLTVILNQDHSKPSVWGGVAVKAGSKDDPNDATGLAHYLEHVLFKGTNQLGTSNWEAEKVYYDQIVTLFEEFRSETDAAKKLEKQKEINELSLKAGEFAIPNEFSNLVQAMGGSGLNAGTGYDGTVYYNSFPPYQLQRWLELYSHRFINPVFRGFQSELETVYEEKNMYSENPFVQIQELLMENSFGKESSYGRPIIGSGEHLKNPSLKLLIEFYEKYYVPSNMALVLSGDIDIEKTKAYVESTFGKWESKGNAVNTKPEQASIEKKSSIKVNYTPYPLLVMALNGIPIGHEDEIALEICSRILSNRNRTGLFDKLTLDGDVSAAYLGLNQLAFGGTIVIQAIPVYDRMAGTYASLNEVEKLVKKELEKVSKGQFEDWILEVMKKELLTEYVRMTESPEQMGYMLTNLFTSFQPIVTYEEYKKKVESITKEDLKRVSSKYFTDNYFTIYSYTGKPGKEKITKPDLKPIVPGFGAKSQFASHLETVPIGEVKKEFINFTEDVKTYELAPKVKFYYTPNEKNNMFSLTIRYGVGTNKIPTLDLATSLMNDAGVMAQYTPHELKIAFSKLNCSCNFYNNDSYTFIELVGDEDNLEEACLLLSKTILMPQLDDKQYSSILGSAIANRSIERNEKDYQANAVRNLIIYGENSPYLKRLSKDEIMATSISKLTGDFIKATEYEASVHYVGKKEFPQVKQILTTKLAFTANRKDSESPVIRPIVESEKPTIYFFHNKDAAQSDIYLYTKGNKSFSIANEPVIEAFNQYFSGGFNGIVLQELRELRSFAYTASCSYQTPVLPGHPEYLAGYIGTQSDKTIDALQEFLKLVNNMPLKPERMENITNYLVQASSTYKPGFRSLSRYVEQLEQLGYTDDPAKVNLAKYESLTFDEIVEFYKQNVQNKNISIGIIGNKKEIDLKKLESIAEVKTLKTSDIFKN